jgi:2-dehydro-3-deoxygluconokinase
MASNYAKSECQYDMISLGEIMLRLDPGEGRIRTARAFQGLGRRRRIQHVARPAQMFRLQNRRLHRVRGQRRRPSHRGFHHAGRRGHGFHQVACRLTASAAAVRNGLNFTERGFGIRGAVGARSRQFRRQPAQARRFRLGPHLRQGRGALAAHRRYFRRVKRNTPQLVIEAVKQAKQHGTMVSYDLNYRPSLWKSIGGQETRAGGQPGDRQICGRDDRQRGGFHRLPRLRGQGASTCCTLTWGRSRK